MTMQLQINDSLVMLRNNEVSKHSHNTSPTRLIICKGPATTYVDDYLEDLSIQHIVNKHLEHSRSNDYIELLPLEFQPSCIVPISQTQKKYKKLVSTAYQYDPEHIDLEVASIEDDGYNMGSMHNFSQLPQIMLMSSEEKHNEEDYYLALPMASQIRKNNRAQQRQVDREQAIGFVHDFLSGQLSILWLFILGNDIPDRYEAFYVYRYYKERGYEVPLCSSYAEAEPYLQIDNCLYKIVADVLNCKEILGESPYSKKIQAVYIYNHLKEKGIEQALTFKFEYRKVKGITMDLEAILKVAREEIANETKLIRDNQGTIVPRKGRNIFPSFLNLNRDSSEANRYRISLYGALKLSEPDYRNYYLYEFQELVSHRYANNLSYLANLYTYSRIDHVSPMTLYTATQILKLYVQYTFFYSLTNTLLRAANTFYYFRPCTIPFNEIYHSIRLYYRYMHLAKLSSFTAYRGTRMRRTDAYSLKYGDYIYMLGFVSTSLSRRYAYNFLTDEDSYLIVIHVYKPSTEYLDEFDHGYVDINKYHLAGNAFEKEQYVLLNALNVYRVKSSQVDYDIAVREIHLEYRAIYKLLAKYAKHDKLVGRQRTALDNYKYCRSACKQVEDDGDVYLLAQYHSKCKYYYEHLIHEGRANEKHYHKLAIAQYYCGYLDAAYSNALRALYAQRLVYVPPNYQLIVSTLLRRTAGILLYHYDYPHYQIGKQKSIEVLGEPYWLEKAKLLRERAGVRFNNGYIKESLTDLQYSYNIIANKKYSFERRRKYAYSRFKFRSLCCLCFTSKVNILRYELDQSIIAIEYEKNMFEEQRQTIEEHLFEVHDLRRRIMEHLGNLQEKQRSLGLVQLHFENIIKTANNYENAGMQAKLAMMRSVISSDFAYRDNEVSKAIRIVYYINPYHEKVGEYSHILGSIRLEQIKTVLIGSISPESVDIDVYPAFLDSFDDGAHYRRYLYCKYALEKSVLVTAYHSGLDSPVCLAIRNYIGDLQYNCQKLLESLRTAYYIMAIKRAQKHSEGAKALLLIAKISLARGYLKKSFRYTQNAMYILRGCLIKAPTEYYYLCLQNSPTYLEISLHRCKLYNKQLKHELALRYLTLVIKITKRQSADQDSSNFLGRVYEEHAYVLVCLGDTHRFETQILRVIEMRERALGRYNIPNAICYANLARHMICMQDLATAESYHFQATELFSKWSADHPNSWIVMLSNGLCLSKKGDHEAAVLQLQKCLRIAQKGYSRNHINLLKIKLQYCLMLVKAEHFHESITSFEELAKELELYMSRSSQRYFIEKEVDDEKVFICQRLYAEMKYAYQKAATSQTITLYLANAGKKKCEEREEVYSRFIKTTMI